MWGSGRPLWLLWCIAVNRLNQAPPQGGDILLVLVWAIHTTFNSPPEPLRLCLRYLWGPPPRPSASAHPADEPGAGGARRLNAGSWSYSLESRCLIYSHFLMFPSQVCATFWSLSWSRPSCTRSGGKRHGEVRNMWPGGFKGPNLSKA